MTQVYIRQYQKRELWSGSDWTGALDLAQTYEAEDAERLIKKRWSKGTRQYYTKNGHRLLRYIDRPYTQTKEQLGRWERI